MTGYTERTTSFKNVTECSIKVQTFFDQYMEKKSAGWMDKIYKNTYGSVVYQQKKQPLSKVSACCRCSYQLDCWLVWA